VIQGITRKNTENPESSREEREQKKKQRNRRERERERERERAGSRLGAVSAA
jgi:hypothetical protein